jgi:hypothetical protein
MSLAAHPILGTIQIEQSGHAFNRRTWDDSTLESLLGSLAQVEVVADEEQDELLVLAAGRVPRRMPWPAAPATAVHANVAQLQADLDAVYAEVTAGRTR